MTTVEEIPSACDTETIRYREASERQPAAVDLLDQTQLPESVVRLVCESVPQLRDAICRLVVRGAPAIGIAAAYGVTLTPIAAEDRPQQVRSKYQETIESLASSRPTAVNLFWALDRMRAIVENTSDAAIGSLPDRLLAEATRIHEEDRSMCRAIGENGADRLRGCCNVLTHCNAGGLATSTLGTALAPLYVLHESGEAPHVYADETRPLLQGARLTAWELAATGVRVTVITDSMAGSLMRAGKVDAVIVGADRITANGDVANKIGTYPLAVLARHHGLPFYVAAPTNTFDLKLDQGDLIEIEQRTEDEVRYPGGPEGRMTVPDQASVFNPAFDVTPAELVTAIITQRGVIDAPDRDKIASHFAEAPRVQ